MSRESLAHALSGPISLQQDEYRERPVDRLHALASAQIRRANRTARESHLASLGVSFIALKAANRPDELERAVEKLAKFLECLKPKVTDDRRKLIARQSIFETVLDFCPRCRGTKEVPDRDDVDGAQRMKPCPAEEEGGCGGSGKRRYSDHERLAALKAGRDEIADVQAHMARAIGILGEAEVQAIKSAKMLLARWS